MTMTHAHSRTPELFTTRWSRKMHCWGSHSWTGDQELPPWLWARFLSCALFIDETSSSITICLLPAQSLSRSIPFWARGEGPFNRLGSHHHMMRSGRDGDWRRHLPVLQDCDATVHDPFFPIQIDPSIGDIFFINPCITRPLFITLL